MTAAHLFAVFLVSYLTGAQRIITGIAGVVFFLVGFGMVLLAATLGELFPSMQANAFAIGAAIMVIAAVFVWLAVRETP